MIRSLALAVAGIVVATGVAGALVPDLVIAAGRHLVSASGLYAAAACRVGVGLVLILAAPGSRAPGMLRAIGAVVLVMGVATPAFGVEAARTRLDWEAAHRTFFRLEGAAFVCLGGLIVSVLRPDRKGSPPLNRREGIRWRAAEGSTRPGAGRGADGDAG